MAIAFDAASESDTGIVQVSSATFSHTCTGSDLVLFVTIYTQGAGTVSGVTYNGTAMTLAISHTRSNDSNHKAHIYYLTNPSTGANNIVVSNSASIYTEATGLSYTGVDQTTPVDNSAYQEKLASSSSIVHAITTTSDNCWALSFAGNSRPTSASTGSTGRIVSNFWGITFCDTNGPQTPAGTINMTQTYATITNMFGLILAFAPAGGGGSTFTPKIMMCT